MYGLQCGYKKGQPALPNEPAGESINQKHIAEMQKEIDPVISGRRIGIPEDCIVEEIRKCCEWAIESRLPSRPPIGVVENQTDILSR